MSLVPGSSDNQFATNQPNIFPRGKCNLILPGNITRVCYLVSFRPKNLLEIENLYAIILMLDIKLRKMDINFEEMANKIIVNFGTGTGYPLNSLITYSQQYTPGPIILFELARESTAILISLGVFFNDIAEPLRNNFLIIGQLHQTPDKSFYHFSRIMPINSETKIMLCKTKGNSRTRAILDGPGRLLAIENEDGEAILLQNIRISHISNKLYSLYRPIGACKFS